MTSWGPIAAAAVLVMATGSAGAQSFADMPLPPVRPIDAVAASPDVQLSQDAPAAGRFRLRPAPVQPRLASPGTGAIETAEPPQRPGSFAFEPTKVPSPFLREKLVAPRLEPPVEIGLGRRSSVGLFGDVGPVDPKGVAPVRVMNRDVGAGLTFQYRFGD